MPRKATRKGSLDDLFVVAEFRTLEQGQSPELARVLAGRTVQTIEKVVPPWQLADLVCRGLRKLLPLSPQQIKDAVIGLIRSMEQEEMTVAASAVQDYRRMSKLTGHGLDPESEANLAMPVADLATSVIKRILDSMEALPLEKWAQAKSTLIEAGIKLASDLLHDPHGQARNDLREALQYGLFHVQSQLLTQNPEHRRWLDPELNLAAVKFVEARKWTRDITPALARLFELGVRGEAKYSNWDWPTFESKSSQGLKAEERASLDEFHDCMVKLFESVVDYFDKEPLADVLDKGARGFLGPSLKCATYNDLLDEKRRLKAKKVIPEEKVVTLGNMASGTLGRDSGGDGSQDLPTAEIANRARFLDSEQEYLGALKSIEDKLFIEQLARTPGLTPREKLAMKLQFEAAVARGDPLSHTELGKNMGVSTVRAKQLWDSVCNKLRTAEHRQK